RLDHLLNLVRTTIAAVLAHPDPDTIDPHQPFKQLGFDSLTTVQLRNHLTHTTGLPLPTTLAFDHPTPHALTTHLNQQLTPDINQGISSENLLSEIRKLEAVLSSVPVGEAGHAEVTARLKDLLWNWENSRAQRPTGSFPDDDLDSATDEELFSALDNELDTP
ncbi:acyl carrier protein, partial [Streptomyces marokkonensis]|uniref:acyl carrier protein n=1 Tax=Streptomyces marokkonensis TaxID=324855 RepID=UPI0011F0D1D0